MTKKKDAKPYRSAHSYAKNDKDGFIHRSWMKSEGLPDDVFDGRPVIGICNTWSELTPCNAHLREIAEYVKRGVWEAGGLPLEFPVMSTGESQMRPTAMLFRNLVSMDVEESIRGNPMDGVVLLGGCDKTTPAQLMGAASVDLPTMVISSGPMLNGKHCGTDIGSGTDVWKFSEDVRAGNMSIEEFMQAESGMSRTPGTCMTMGSASTFACVVEAMGLSLPFNGTIPAVDARRKTMSHLTGRRIVDLVKEDRKLSAYLTRPAMENAIRVLAAIGGSTNAVIHLQAIAGRMGIDLCLDDFDQLTKDIPLLVDIQPSGKYLMEDFHYAGGVPYVMQTLGKFLDQKIETVSGQTVGEITALAEGYNDDVLHSMQSPVKENAGIWVLRGNLCPKGAIIKPSAASDGLLTHEAKAVVFENIEDLKARIDDPELDVDENSILVLKGCGPKGYPGMPEVANMPLPQKILEKGVRDMVRISDARMSGTAFGTVILHVSPETEIGGPLSFVENGDMIRLDGPARTLDVLISEEELARRTSNWQGPETAPKYDRGYYKLYIDHVLQADEGADLDFLVGKSGSIVTRESH
ncbi:MAG: dihydroxy-acid dehydratase [Kordiimonadaceae bacterium]|jgi:dehydratase ilvD1|nr:dihydroxy-acid dehydratase [Kordiimonadaceae bacterium]MBT6037348.1 dihydroxy-acid dehydratase [Kordiimonadaceae bacterium]MBT6328849.1 dihydroxy-acid dehydratase [Kordiimonadaceae bacterium]